MANVQITFKGIDNASSVISQVKNTSDGLATALGKLGSSGSSILSSVGSGVLKLGETGVSAMSSFIGSSVKASTEFNAKMSEVAAVSGATGIQLNAMKQKALELGAQFPVSASDAADAMGELAKAGMTADQAISASTGTVQLASATHYTMADSATILATSLNGFGLAADQANRVTDLLAQTANASAVDVKDLGKTFEYVGPIAKVAGFSIEDVSKATGLLGNAGIKGTAAGTGLRTILTQLASPSDKAKAAFDQLGYSITDSAGKIKPLGLQMTELREKFAGLSQSEKIDLAQKIAGKEHMSKLLAIVDATPDSFKQMSDAIDGAGGAGKRMADTMNDNVAGAMENLKGSVETVQIKIGNALQPAIKILLNLLADLLNQLNPLIDKLVAGLTPVLETAANKFKDMVPAVESFLVKLEPIAVKIFEVVSAFSPLNTVLDVFVGFLNGGVAGAVTAFGQHIVAAGNVLGVDLSGAVSTATTFINGTLLPTLGNIGTFIQTTVVPAIMEFASWLGSTLGPIFTSIGTTITTTVVPAISQFAGFIQSTLIPMVAQAAAWIGQTLVPVIQSIAAFIANPVIPMIGQLVSVVLTTVIPTLTSWVQVIASFLKPIIEALASFIQNTLLPIMTTIVNFIISNVLPAFKNIGDWINANVMPVLQQLAEFLGNALASAFRMIQTVVEGVWQQIQNAIKTAWGVIQGVFNIIKDVLRGDFAGAFRDAQSLVQTVWQGIQTAISDAWATISGLFDQIVSFLATTLGDAFNTLLTVAGNVWNGIVSAISGAVGQIGDAAGQIVDFFAQIPGKIWDLLSSLPGKLADIGRNMIASLVRGLTSIHISLPHISVSWSNASFGPVDVPIPNFSVAWYAKGGIFNSPQVIGVGESGSEAVVPIDKLVPLLTDALKSATGANTRNTQSQAGTTNIFNLTANYAHQERTSLVNDIKMMQQLGART
jgi:TP901 family phage tail tape measure protein